MLQFIASGKIRGTLQGKIICLSGPPGVGKTSICQSFARALNLKLFQFSIGGLSYASEIKGCHRLCIGAMPGKMVQCLKNVGTANPLVLIDGIDKLSKGPNCNPIFALLELLDPDQNAKFWDCCLDVPIDLSKVLFVCTANDVDNVSKPLLDRMEVIAMTEYFSNEKMDIARSYLEKNMHEAWGIKSEQVEVRDAALLALIENYCRGAGVGNLQKHIEKIYDKIAQQLVLQGKSIESAVAGEVVEASEAKAESLESVTKIETEIVEYSSHEQTTETSLKLNSANRLPNTVPC